jgi:hypothetical protein
MERIKQRQRLIRGFIDVVRQQITRKCLASSNDPAASSAWFANRNLTIFTASALPYEQSQSNVGTSFTQGARPVLSMLYDTGTFTDFLKIGISWNAGS